MYTYTCLHVCVCTHNPCSYIQKSYKAMLIWFLYNRKDWHHLNQSQQTMSFGRSLPSHVFANSFIANSFCAKQVRIVAVEFIALKF